MNEPQPEARPKLMRIREAAEALGLPQATLYRATRAYPGHPFHLPHLRIGKIIYTSWPWVEEWLKRNRSDGGSPLPIRRVMRRKS